MRNKSAAAGFFRRLTAVVTAAAVIAVNTATGGMINYSFESSALSYDSTSCGITEGGNAGEQNYERGRYAKVPGSYLSELSDGRLMRVQSDGSGGLDIEYYSSDLTFSGYKHVSAGLPIFGGFYAGSDGNYYVLSGQSNSDESDSVETFRITKYNSDWSIIATDRLYGANTVEPFAYGGSDFAEGNGYIVVRTCHRMYKSTDGLNHQAVVLLQIEMSTGKITDHLVEVDNRAGYVSHSFGQKIVVDDGFAVTADQSDAYPRSINFNMMTHPVADGNVASRLSRLEMNYIRSNVYEVSGKIGNNDMGVSLGGFEYSDTSYIAAINSIDVSKLTAVDSGTDTNDYSGTRNIIVLSVPKTDSGFGTASVRRITDYAEGTESASTPVLVKTGDSSFMLLWTRADKLYYTTLDSRGNAGTVLDTDGELSDCQPIVYNGKVVWYTYEDDKTTFYQIDTADVSDVKKVTVQNGHDYNVTGTVDGVSTLECSKCGEKITLSVPTGLTVFSKKSPAGTYERKSAVTMEPGETLYLLYSPSPITADNTETVLSSYDDKLLRFDRSARTLTALRPGKTTAVFSARYNPEAKYSLTVTVNGACTVNAEDNITVRKNGVIISDGGMVNVDDKLTVSVTPPEGKKLAALYANGKEIPNGGTYTVVGDVSFTAEFKDRYTVKIPQYVTVRRNDAVLTDGGDVDKGDKLVIISNLPAGKELISLYVNDEPIADRGTYVVEGNTVVTIEYEDIYTLTKPDDVTVIRGEEILSNGDRLRIGDVLTVTAIPPEEQELAYLVVNGATVENNSTYTVAGNTTVKAYFIDVYTINIPENVTVVRDADETLESGDRVKAGDKLTITADPPTGQKLAYLAANGEEIQSGKIYTVTGNTVITVQFTERYTIIIPDNVTVRKNGTEYLRSGDDVDKGDSLKITAAAPIGKYLALLSVNGKEIQSGDTYNVEGNVIIYAQFKDELYRVTIPENVSVRRNGAYLSNNDIVAVGDSLYITVNAPDGKKMKGLYVNDSRIDPDTAYIVTGNTVITVDFGDTYKITIPDNVTVTKNGSVTLKSGDPIEAGDRLVINAQEPEGKKLKFLTVNGTSITNGGTYNVTGNTVIEASFSDTYTITISDINIDVTKNGSTSLKSGDTIEAGDILFIAATSPVGKVLSYLTINGERIENRYQYTVKGDTVINAFFEDVYTITMSDNVKVIKNGYITLMDGDRINPGDTLVITADPPAGKVLSSLTVNGSAFTSGGTYTVTGNTVVAAVVEDAASYTVRFPSTVHVKRNDVNLKDYDPVSVGDALLITVVVPDGKNLKTLSVNGETIQNHDTYIVKGDTVIEAEFEDTTAECKVIFEDTVKVTLNGVSIAAGSRIASGLEIVITAYAPTGKKLKTLSVNGDSITSGSTYKVTGYTSIQATFEVSDEPDPQPQPESCTVISTSRVTVTLGGSVIASGSKVAVGSQIVITANTPTGKRLKSITVNGSAISGNTYIVNGYTSVDATFEDDTAASSYTVSIQDNITVTRNGTALASGSHVSYGDVLVITANPPYGKRLVSLTVNGGTMLSGGTYTVVGNTVISAVFEDDPGTVTNTYTVVIPNYVTVTRNGITLANGSSVSVGDVLVIKADTPSGSTLRSLTVNGASITSGGTYTVTGNTTIRVTFNTVSGNTANIYGTVTLRGSRFESAVITLLDQDNRTVDYAVEYGGSYSFTNISQGSYTLLVSCRGYVPRRYTVDAYGSSITVNTELCRYGDVTRDGVVDAKDATQILRYWVGLPGVIRDAAGNVDEYLCAVGAVYSNDGIPAPRDATQILRSFCGYDSVFDYLGI